MASVQQMARFVRQTSATSSLLNKPQSKMSHWNLKRFRTYWLLFDKKFDFEKWRMTLKINVKVK